MNGIEWPTRIVKKKKERKKTNTGTHPALWTHTKRNEGLQVKASAKLPAMWGVMWVSHVALPAPVKPSDDAAWATVFTAAS